MDLVKEKVKAIVCLGTDNRKIHEAFGNDVSADGKYSKCERSSDRQLFILPQKEMWYC